ncbi:MAG: hypothetical protein HYU41_24195 [Candidatus Rokubacteria bacterium]|nr:hypothetical protein [Candidatus Rokubacteria bacterium]
MDRNEYAIEALVKTRIEEAMAIAARRRLLVDRRPGLRARLGGVLVAAGAEIGALGARLAQLGQRLATGAAATTETGHA